MGLRFRLFLQTSPRSKALQVQQRIWRGPSSRKDARRQAIISSFAKKKDDEGVSFSSNADASFYIEESESESLVDGDSKKQGHVPRGPVTQLPEHFKFCEICATGDGIMICDICEGKGQVKTRPGGAGVRGMVGMARCKECNGLGVVPCPICSGMEG